MKWLQINILAIVHVGSLGDIVACPIDVDNLANVNKSYNNQHFGQNDAKMNYLCRKTGGGSALLLAFIGFYR